ncbi:MULTISPECIES: hypothetical protein [Bradyrhizobium]|jgi:hypothetical protein|uniref:Uncharacterized protein n=1 Tax=Bradyrhizobium japonicum TaxID=375 RepID=A0A1L3F967_BRAJP|nr:MULTISPECIES: hypothetical protein [Bradyrhizobium]APG09876.1 hypothetical protein BKD09_16200 [Bradyrhizobium japonicum]MCK1441541.1 hypothetical protein [Bradyrhizobium sp. 48]MCP1766034.1 hypothetical protein [Bradyrhizobium japonicum]MCP1788171.1 hypothetical protein [Bradyrhizobium japonicum]MCP1810047.1 hypothetical protein [Bradyrhizobium japonicum]
MKILFLLATVTALVDVTSAAQAEPPTFELKGFPITPHQVAVVGGTGVQEQAFTPALMFGGMPASPHQITVLKPRPGTMAKATAAKPTTVGLAVK